jgi:hypothetical protein
MNQEEDIRSPDLQFTTSLIDNESGINSELFAINETRNSSVSRHGKISAKETPKMNYRQ